MTHAYAACMLLEHGPLTFREFHEITGWSEPVADKIIRILLKRRHIERVVLPECHRWAYRLA